MKAIVFDRFGEPDEVLSVREVADPEPGPGEVRARMLFSPINPSDLLVVRGRYGVLPKLPATPGFEGVGVIDKAGPGLLGKLVLGRRVAVLNNRGGNWAEYAVIPARQAVRIPDDLPDEQIASFFVNPATVLALVRHELKVPRGEWLLQSAAGSALGRMIIKLGQHDGFLTINVVRRKGAIDELKSAGADAVISSSEGPIEDQVRRIVGSSGVKYALDCVGGDVGTALFNSLAPGGRMIVYGTLSNEPIRIDPRLMIAEKRIVEGFWLGHWMPKLSHGALGIPKALGLFHEIANLIRSGVLATETGGVFALDDISDAARQAEAVGRRGKVLLRIGSK